MRPEPPTDLAQWRRVEAILDLALVLPPEERADLLDQACAGDPELRSKVEALLAADEKAGSFLGVPASEYEDLLDEGTREQEVTADLAGRPVGPYRLLREIGSGGMGTVYEAEDTRLGRRVAVKILPPEYSRDRRAKERFLREARTASAVDHPNLCTVHDVGESEGRLYIVLALYEGETLRERIRRGPLPPADARDIAIQVARGLARAHEAGITHRDIKPANVMLPRRGEAKILDFGIARLEGDEVSLTGTGVSWGTPAYMSPEQVRGEPVDCRTDVWSLGVLLYEMVAGRRPFKGDGVQAVLSAILTQEPEPLDRVRPEVPPELAQVVTRALAKDPAARYKSAVELLADLESEKAPAASRALRLKRWTMASRRSLFVGVLVLLAFFACVLAWRFWYTAAPPLRLAILYPKTTSTGDNPELAYVPSEVIEATLATLVSLEGLQPLDPPEKDEKSGFDAEKQRSEEADEVLQPHLDCRGDWCQATFRRLRKSGGEVLNLVGPFEVPVGMENAYQLAEGVRVHLQQLYRGRRLRPGSPGGKVRPEDYSAYIRLERRSNERLGNNEISQLDNLLRTSPDLLGAYLMAANISRNHRAIDQALTYVNRAEKVAPYDPGPLFTRLRIELEGNRLDAAGTTLARLESLSPSDIRVQSARADLLEARGALENALPLREEVSRRRPTWNNILELVTLEFRLGASKSARRRLEVLLEARPDNQWIQEHLAALEAVFGDLNRAEALFEELVRARPVRPFLTNLGYVRFLLGNYAKAIAADRQALALEPHHFLTRFNLILTLEAQGDLTGARRICKTLVEEFATSPTPLDTRARLQHAQCLARLGDRAGAERIAGEVLKQRPEDVQDLHEAAQLYALLGERLSVLYYTELALKKGLRREWFMIPGFRSLIKENPDFRALLNSPALKSN
jgi:tetratricopeptide (TPR) repeat protein